MGLILPDFAKPIADARARGERPAMLVIVSDGDLGLHRRFPDNPVVRVRPEQRGRDLDWRFLAGLDVEYVTPHLDRRGIGIVQAIDAARPLNFRVWNIDTGKMMRVVFFGVRNVVPESPYIIGDVDP